MQAKDPVTVEMMRTYELSATSDNAGSREM
jgi:hypothetical protein